MTGDVNMDDRAKLLRQDGLLIGVALVCLLNGMHFSPWMGIFAAALSPLLASFYISSPVLLFYFASLTLSVTTAILSGIPAALFEKARGQTESNPASLTVWFVSALVLSIPAMIALFR